MKDYIIRATAANGQIRAFAATTKEMLEFAREAHDTSPVASAALGRTMTAAAMMGIMLKGDKDLLTITVRGNGPLAGITVTADKDANVKGYVFNPHVDLPPNKEGKLDVASAVGIGLMNIIKDIGLKEPYVGQTHLVTSEIAEDLTHYFYHSEQIPSVVSLGVLVDKDTPIKQSGGFIIQLMPGAEEEIIAFLEEKIKEVKAVTTLFEEGYTPEAILEELLGEKGLQINEKVPAKFYCNCSKDRVEKALISVGREDLQSMIDDNEPIEMNCHFCNKNYEFKVEELEELVKNI
ncbi:Hsp33 family molecular chaperone HslO [Vallitalea okinawensis]|uniref:Hsp33 family molecular chaperone HslO n=1 Tax=Vallitalea okinawensis TaxID=2078660 RepID=UPI000CFCB9E3|nr:Hsp33 family molecular chaperone HslO [Vallitalea okinawensis]